MKVIKHDFNNHIAEIKVKYESQISDLELQIAVLEEQMKKEIQTVVDNYKAQITEALEYVDKFDVQRKVLPKAIIEDESSEPKVKSSTAIR